MLKKVTFKTRTFQFDIILFNTNTAKIIYSRLP